MQDLSLVYNFEKAKSNPESAPLVVMIHGYGSHENDLFELRLALGSTAHYLSLRASINLGFGVFAWYPIHFGAGGIKTYDTDAAAQSRDLVLHFIQEFQAKEGLESNPLWLMGFSQGAILSYGLALSHPDKFQRIMALSGYVLKEIVPEQYRPADLQHLDFFVSHGREDAVIPISAARMTVDFLEKLQIKHRYQEYNSGHGINPENLRDLQQWFQRGFK